jgi:L-threonylcarbamoyladenylate synthase
MQTLHSINQVETLLKRGAVDLMPTDTIYGLVGCTNNPLSINKLYKLNSNNKPVTVIASGIDQLVDLGLVRRYLRAAEDFWPGPISVMIPCSNELNYLSQGTNWLAVRTPKHKGLIKLLKATGPLLTLLPDVPTLNLGNINKIKSVYQDKLDFYVMAESNINKEPSAIIKIIDDAIEVIRPGYSIKTS